MLEYLIERGHLWSELRKYPLPLIASFFWAGVKLEDIQFNRRAMEGVLLARGVLPSLSNDTEGKTPKVVTGGRRAENDFVRLKKDMRSYGVKR